MIDYKNEINFDLLLDILILDIIPQTIKNVAMGNKIFAAAILNKKDLSIVTIGLNNEIKNPLLHGEISTINNFFELNRKLNPTDYIFLSTHEPCSLCLSAITWAGFDNFYFFFPFNETKNKFSIPHDLKILSEIFKIEDGSYNSNNFYWKSYSIIDEINKLSNKNIDKFNLKIKEIYDQYDDLSLKYQQNKDNNPIKLK